MTDDDTTRELVRRIFGDPADRPPPDVVPPSGGLTREALERQSANYGKQCTGRIPGELVEGVDGDMIGFTEPRSLTSSFGGTYITQQQADEFGIEEGQLPGIFIIETPRDKGKTT